MDEKDLQQIQDTPMVDATVPDTVSDLPAGDSVSSPVMDTPAGDSMETPVTEHPVYDSQDAPASDAPAFGTPVQEDAAPKRNYERYLEKTQEPQAAENPFMDEQGPFMQGGFEANSFESNTFESNSFVPPVQPSQPVNVEGLEEPVSMGEWLVCILLMLVPCANIILMFVWAFSKTEKKSKSNFFKVELIMMGVILALYLVILIAVVAFAAIGVSLR